MEKLSLKELAVPIIKAIDSCNYLLKSHHRRTAVITYHIGKKMGLEQDQLFRLVISAAIHDVGALSVQERDSLIKEDVLNPRPHCEMGSRMLSSFGPFEGVARVIKYHHIHYDDFLSMEYAAHRYVAGGAQNVRVIYPADGVIAAPEGVAIVAGCKHPEEAKALTDYLLSRPVVEAIFQKYFRRPARPDATAVEGMFTSPSPLEATYFLLMTTSTFLTIGLIMLVSQRLSDQLRSSKLFLESTLNGLSANIALINAAGEIVLVNEAWRQFAVTNGISQEFVSEGVNYLRVCEGVCVDNAGEANSFAQGIRDVLDGKLETFSMEYGCHSPERKRWFLGRVNPFRGEGPRMV